MSTLKRWCFSDAGYVTENVLEDAERHGDWTGALLGQNGNALQKLGEYRAAKELHEQGLEIQKNHLGEDHVTVAKTLGNLGVVYRNLGEYNKAKDLYEQALEIKKKHYGEDHVEVAKTIMNLGVVYSDLGDYN